MPLSTVSALRCFRRCSRRHGNGAGVNKHAGKAGISSPDKLLSIEVQNGINLLVYRGISVLANLWRLIMSKQNELLKRQTACRAATS
jgi:hypothetical protein